MSDKANNTLKNPAHIDLNSHGVIEASAGTGKTYTLERLYVRMLVERNLDPSAIIAVTFTEKATADIKTRVRDLLLKIVKQLKDEGASETLEEFYDHKPDKHLTERLENIVLDFSTAEISTIHGFCRRLLLEYAEVSGFSEDLQVADDLTFIYKSELQNLLYEFGKTEYGSSELFNTALIENTEKYMKQFLNPSYMLENIDDTDYNEKEKEFFKAYQEQVIDKFKENVQKRKKELKLTDYDDLLIQANKLLENKDVKEEVSQRFQFGMIDEFQDTDPLQYSIFRKIFIESKSDNRLFVIGDPKQSIYRFKGADVFTYRQAKDEIINQNKGKEYSLVYNYRSAPAMIEALNKVFKTKTEKFWFKDGYPEAKAPEQKEEKNETELKSAPVRFVEFNLNNQTTSSQTQEDYYKTFPAIIKNLFEEMASHPNNNLNYSDIAILVRKGKEGAAVSEILSDAGIPGTSGKTENLYATDEAKHVYYLLKALEEPFSESALNTAAMTDFFGSVTVTVNDEHQVKKEVKEQIFKWYETAQKKKWPDLFAQIENEAGLINRFINDIHYERKITDYRHLFHSLADYAARERAGLLEMIIFLEKKIWGEKKSEDEEAARRIETDEDKVKILTMHAAKGLEFKVVIVAGGFGGPGKNKDIIYHDEAKNQRIIGLWSCTDKTNSTNKKPSDIADQEELEEEKRLFYVAFTRAINCLYLPFTENIKKTKDGKFNKNSVCFQDRISEEIWSQPGFDDENLFETVAEFSWNGNKFEPTGKTTKKALSSGKIDLPVSEESQQVVNLTIPVWQHKSEYRGRFITSFSSLVKINEKHKRLENEITLSETTEAAPREEDEVDDNTESVQVYQLPRGAQSGNFLHYIFEHADFYGVKEPALNDDIKQRIEKALPLFYRNLTGEKMKAFQKETEQIFYKSVNVTLTGTDKVSLSDIPFEDTRRELEFLWQGAEAGIMLTGFIDLVFRVNDRYYILDYKSNTLPGYSRPHLEAVMQKTYALQGKLYSGALHRYLKSVLNDYDPTKNFGGCYFLFLRGVETGQETGIYFMPSPDEKKLDDYAKLVSFKHSGGEV